MRRVISLFATSGALLVACGALAAGCGSTPGGGGDDTVDPIDAAPDVPADAAACGVRTGMRGKTSRTINAGGLDRTYHVYLPSSLDPSTPVPLVFVHHGFTMSGQLMFDITEYAALADAEGIALAFPDGQGGPSTNEAPWNVGTGLCPSSFGAPPSAMGDDFAMLDAIKADISADQCLDREHVYVTGFSMGGYFSHHAGCMRSDVRAIAPHSGGTHDLTGCINERRPVIIFHGTGDGLIYPGCADPSSIAVPNGEPSATLWAEHNGCASTVTTRQVQGGTCKRYDGCPAGGQVELCMFTGMGHCWAGGAATAGVYSCSAYESATQLAWDFFKTYAW